MKTLKNYLLRGATLLMVLGTVLPAMATDYVFVYNNNYLSVNANGQVANSTSLTAGCVWTCVASTTDSEHDDFSSLDNTNNRYLYTIVNGTKYWLRRNSTTNGDALTVTDNPSQATAWRNNTNRLWDGTRYVGFGEALGFGAGHGQGACEEHALVHSGDRPSAFCFQHQPTLLQWHPDHQYCRHYCQDSWGSYLDRHHLLLVPEQHHLRIGELRNRDCHLRANNRPTGDANPHS